MAAVSYLLSQGDVKSLSNPARITAVGGDNATPFYLKFPFMSFGQRWVFPFTYGFMYPIESPSYAAVAVDTTQTPPTFPTAPISTQQAELTAYDTDQSFNPGIASSNTRQSSLAIFTSAPKTVTVSLPAGTQSIVWILPSGTATMTITGVTTGFVYSNLGIITGPYSSSVTVDSADDTQVIITVSALTGPAIYFYAADFAITTFISGGNVTANIAPAITLPSGAAGSTSSVPTAQGIRKATFKADVNAITTGALVAATDKFLFSMEHGVGSVKTTRIQRIILNAVITTAGAAAGGIKFYLYTGTTASTGGSGLITPSNNQRNAGSSETTVKSLPIIVSATGPKNVHGLWAPAAIGALQPNTEIVFYERVIGDTEELTLRAGFLESIILAVQAVSTPTLTVYITVEFTEE